MSVNLAEGKQVDIFNRNNPVGTRVRYRLYDGSRDGSYRETMTRTEAYLLGGHTACVFLVGVTGCVPLSRVDVIKEEVPHA
jgi:hypothetical protein